MTSTQPPITVIVPASVTVNGERPKFVRFGWPHPSVAVFEDGREVQASYPDQLAELLGMPRWTSFVDWRQVDESAEDHRRRTLPKSSYSGPEGRWCVRLDWGCAYVLLNRSLVGTCSVRPLRRGRVQVKRYAGQPSHTVQSIRLLALLVAGEKVGTPMDVDDFVLPVARGLA